MDFHTSSLILLSFPFSLLGFQNYPLGRTVIEYRYLGHFGLELLDLWTCTYTLIHFFITYLVDCFI